MSANEIPVENTENMFNGDPIVISQQLFEKLPPNKISNVLKEIGKEVVKKNNNLKTIFSSNYNELLNCSSLLSNINGYSKEIAELSKKPAQTLQHIFDLNLDAAVIAKEAASLGQQSNQIDSKKAKEILPTTVSALAESVDILLSQTIKLFQKRHLFSIAARQIISIKLLLQSIRLEMKTSTQPADLFSRIFGDKVLFANEILLEIFDESLRFLLSQSIPQNEIENNQTATTTTDSEEDQRIWIYIDAILCICLLLQATESPEDKNTLLAAQGILKQLGFQVGSQGDNLRECVSMIWELKLKNLEKQPNITKFMNYFTDFYSFVQFFNKRTLFSNFLKLYNELATSTSDFTYLSYFAAFKSFKDLKEHQQSILEMNEDEDLQDSEEDPHRLTFANNRPQHQNILSLIHSIYNSQFISLSKIIRAMLISTDDEGHSYFNHHFFERIIFDEKNIKMIEHIKEVLDQIYSEQRAGQNSQDIESLHQDLKTIVHEVWKDFYLEQITKHVSSICLEDIVLSFKTCIMERVGQSLEFSKYGIIKYEDNLQAEYDSLSKKVTLFTSKIQTIFGFNKKNDSEYEYPTMLSCLNSSIASLIENYHNSLTTMWDQYETSPSFDLLKIFIIFLFFHNYLVESISKIIIREGTPIEWDSRKLEEISIYIEDRIQEISDELIKRLNEEHSPHLDYEQVFAIYLYELDEFLHNFIESGSVKQLEISRTIILSIFSALENETNSTFIQSLMPAKAAGTKRTAVSAQPENIKFPNISYILGNTFGLQPREFFEKESEKELVQSIAKLRKQFKESLIPIQSNLAAFLLFPEQLQFIQTANVAASAAAATVDPRGIARQPQKQPQSQQQQQLRQDTNSPSSNQNDSQSQQTNPAISSSTAAVQQTAKQLVGEVQSKFKTASSLISKFTKN